jgi:hypothetical protein
MFDISWYSVARCYVNSSKEFAAFLKRHVPVYSLKSDDGTYLTRNVHEIEFAVEAKEFRVKEVDYAKTY